MPDSNSIKLIKFNTFLVEPLGTQTAANTGAASFLISQFATWYDVTCDFGFFLVELAAAGLNWCYCISFHKIFMITELYFAISVESGQMMRTRLNTCNFDTHRIIAI